MQRRMLEEQRFMEMENGKHSEEEKEEMKSAQGKREEGREVKDLEDSRLLEEKARLEEVSSFIIFI